MRAYLKLALVIAEDDGLENTRFDNRKNPLIIDQPGTNTPALASGSGKTVIIPADSTYHRVSLDGVTPTWLYIESDQNVTVRLNSLDGTSGTEIPITPIVQTVPAPTPGQVLPPQNGGFFLRGLLGAFDVWVKNQSTGLTAAPANVTVAYAG